jgi:microcystin-dependent protein
LLVGPQFSQGTLTGPIVENIVDTNNITHSVVTNYASNSSTGTSYRLTIISKDTFIPKLAISGFVTINQGVNLSSVDASTGLTRFWGTAQSADSLLVNGKTLLSSNFLTTEGTTNTTTSSLNIKSNAGINLGTALGFNIGVNSSTTIFTSITSGHNIAFNLNNGSATQTLTYFQANGTVGIGFNNTAPTSTLDVMGTLTIKPDTTNTPSGGPGRLLVTGTTNSTTTSTGSIVTSGGLGVALNSNFGQDISVFASQPNNSGGGIILNNLSAGAPVAGAVVVPGYSISSSEAQSLNIPYVTAGAGLYDIGTATRPFRNVYAQSFVGTFNGSFTGSLAGSVNGSAAKLASPTQFSLTGDVVSNVVSFNGQSTTGTAIFNTQINQNFITTKSDNTPRTSATDSNYNDALLVYQTGAGLVQMSKQTLFNHVATVPVGCIFPFAGTVVPTGYLLCDGSEVQISKYNLLYSVIGYNYKAAILLKGQGTFALPDLRGRFPLGRDNMNNNLTVPYKDGSGTQISAGGGAANRVSDITADIIGTGAGSQQVTLGVANLPDHLHDLKSNAKGVKTQYFAGGIPNAASDEAATKGLGLPNDGSTGYGLNNSGSVISDSYSVPINIMNPYETINYIIFTGVL